MAVETEAEIDHVAGKPESERWKLTQDLWDCTRGCRFLALGIFKISFKYLLIIISSLVVISSLDYVQLEYSPTPVYSKKLTLLDPALQSGSGNC